MTKTIPATALFLVCAVTTACGGGGGSSSSGNTSSSSGGPSCTAPSGHSVLIYTGSGGGGPSSDINVDTNLKTPLQQGGTTVTVSTSLPADFDTAYGVLFLMNPIQALPTSVVDAAVALVQRGGQVVSLMDHDGWGNAEAHNAFYAAAGSTLRLNVAGASGTLPLVIHPFTGLTEGVASLTAFYSGAVTGGQAVGDVTLDSPARTVTVVAAEKVGCGRVVAVADVSIFGYAAAAADNLAFLKKLGQVP